MKDWTTPEKARWREEFWSFVDATMPCELRETAHVVLLVGKDGLEIPLALECGIPEANIHCVDQNAAIIATAKWRATYPDVKCYGTRLSVAMPRIAASIPDSHAMRVLNMDFCSNLNARLLDELTRIAHEAPIELGCIVQINALRGREDPLVPVLLSELGYDDRADFLMHWFGDRRGASRSQSIQEVMITSGIYGNGRSTMSWGRMVALGLYRPRSYRGTVRDVGPLHRWYRADGDIIEHYGSVIQSYPIWHNLSDYEKAGVEEWARQIV